MPLYETLVFIRGRCQPSEVLNVITRAAQDLTRDGGVIRCLDNLGKRPLAYPMTKQKQKSRFGYLYRFRADCSPSSLAQMDRVFRLDENVLRFMTTRLNQKKIVVDDIEPFQDKLEPQRKTHHSSRSDPAANDRLAWLFKSNGTPVASQTPVRPNNVLQKP